ncbi:Excalibur calcium-binding domain protein [compost metagenome]
MHISSLTFDGKAPEAGERVSYQLGTGKDGKPCAVQVFFPDRPMPRRNESSRLPPSMAQSAAPRPRRQPTYRRKSNWRGKLIPLLVLAGLFSIYSRFSAESGSPPPASSSSQGEASTSYSTSQAPAFARQCDGRQHCSQMTSCEEATWFLRNCPNMKMDGEGDGIPCEDQWCGH